MDSFAWIKGAEKLIDSALADLDAMPLHGGSFEHWKSARRSVFNAGKGLSDLRRLAEIIARNEQANHQSDKAQSSPAPSLQAHRQKGRPPSKVFYRQTDVWAPPKVGRRARR